MKVTTTMAAMLICASIGLHAQTKESFPSRDLPPSISQMNSIVAHWKKIEDVESQLALSVNKSRSASEINRRELDKLNEEYVFILENEFMNTNDAQVKSAIESELNFAKSRLNVQTNKKD